MAISHSTDPTFVLRFGLGRYAVTGAYPLLFAKLVFIHNLISDLVYARDYVFVGHTPPAGTPLKRGRFI